MFPIPDFSTIPKSILNYTLVTSANLLDSKLKEVSPEIGKLRELEKVIFYFKPNKENTGRITVTTQNEIRRFWL